MFTWLCARRKRAALAGAAGKRSPLKGAPGRPRAQSLTGFVVVPPHGRGRNSTEKSLTPAEPSFACDLHLISICMSSPPRQPRPVPRRPLALPLSNSGAAAANQHPAPPPRRVPHVGALGVARCGQWDPGAAEG